MATQAQIDANRRNAQKSAGPRTDAGKAKSSRNGLIHGMDAEKHTFPGEDPEAVSLFVDRYHDHFHPVGPLEEDLVDCLASAMWRRRRFNAMEAGLVRMRVKLTTPPEKIQSDFEINPLPFAFHHDCTYNNSFSKLARYQAHQRRDFESSLHELNKEQGARIAKPKPGPGPVRRLFRLPPKKKRSEPNSPAPSSAPSP